ncbi:MAG: hypothetical protein EBV83_02525 [Verrucomicrobia bacterium]|nr:hypothetical protein [Verrucomicrobiota bacterium]
MRRVAKTDSVLQLGGAPIPTDRRKLKQIFWLGNLGLLSYLIFFNNATVSIERLGYSFLLLVAIMLPSWFWVSGRSHGLPIFPLYCLSFFPAYAIPLCRGDSRFAQYTELQITNGVLTVVGYLFLATLIWQQCTNRNLKPEPYVREIDPRGFKLMIFLLSTGLIFEIGSAVLGDSRGGAYQAFRGYVQNSSRLAIFVLFFQMGAQQLGKIRMWMVILITTGLVVRQAASIVLANTFPVVGLALAGFFLGSGKMPWKSLMTVVGMIILLHSGKAEMRSIYYREGVTITLADYPAFFAEWLAKGVAGLVKGETSEGVKVQSAKERSALLPLLLQVQKMTGTEVPYLDGVSYGYLPSMLVPRIITKDKAVSHISNMIMAIHYGVLTMENVWFTSIAFDLVIEAYANYGYGGVAGLAIIMGLFLGLVTLGTTGVPLFSFRFLLGILVLSAVISSNNTMGVFMTSSWQGFLALTTLAFIIMRKGPNPLYANPEKMAGGGREGAQDEGLRLGLSGAEDGEQRAEAGSERHTGVSHQLEEKPERHQRPTRFVYGEGRKDANTDKD